MCLIVLAWFPGPEFRQKLFQGPTLLYLAVMCRLSLIFLFCSFLLLAMMKCIRCKKNFNNLGYLTHKKSCKPHKLVLWEGLRWISEHEKVAGPSNSNQQIMAEPPGEPPGLAETEVVIIQVHYHNIFNKNLGIIIFWHRNWPKSQQKSLIIENLANQIEKHSFQSDSRMYFLHVYQSLQLQYANLCLNLPSMKRQHYQQLNSKLSWILLESIGCIEVESPHTHPMMISRSTVLLMDLISPRNLHQTLSQHGLLHLGVISHKLTTQNRQSLAHHISHSRTYQFSIWCSGSIDEISQHPQWSHSPSSSHTRF